MRKIFAFLLTAIMLISAFSVVSVKSETPDIVISYNADDVKYGEEFEITVQITNNSDENANACTLFMDYDNTVLEYKGTSLGIDLGDEWKLIASDESVAYFNDSNEIPYVSVVKPGETFEFVLTFKVIGMADSEFEIKESEITVNVFDPNELTDASTTVEVASPAKIIGASLQVGSGIELCFTGIVPTGYEGAEMCFAQELVKNGAVTSEDVAKAAGTKTGTLEENGTAYTKYDYVVPVNPDRLGDKFCVYLVYDGVVISDEKNYSVLDYCNKIFADGKELLPDFTDEQLTAFETLLCDLLAYGEKAQKYTEYNTDSLVTDSVIDGYTLSPSTFEEITSTDFKLTESSVTDPKLTSISMTLDSNFWLSYKISASSADNVKMRVVVNTGEKIYHYYPESKDLIETDESGVYYLHLKPAATGIDYVYTVTVYDANDEQGRAVSYSAKSYVYENQDDTGALGDLVKTIYNYGRSIKNYADVVGL